MWYVRKKTGMMGIERRPRLESLLSKILSELSMRFFDMGAHHTFEASINPNGIGYFSRLIGDFIPHFIQSVMDLW